MAKREPYTPRIMFFLDSLLEGKKSKLTVICPTKERRIGCVVYECLCECGNRAFMISREIQKNMSCGCSSRKYGSFKVKRKYGVKKEGE